MKEKEVKDLGIAMVQFYQAGYVDGYSFDKLGKRILETDFKLINRNAKKAFEKRFKFKEGKNGRLEKKKK
jgi:hypothetical protein